MSLKTPSARRWFDREMTQHPYCHYCAAPVSVTPNGDGRTRRATADHIIPRSFGGTDALDNLVLACHRCNQAKAHKPVVCWCDRCCEALAYYATKYLNPVARGYKHGMKSTLLNELALQGKV